MQDDQQDRHIYCLLADEPPNIVRMLENDSQLVQIPMECMLKHATKHH